MKKPTEGRGGNMRPSILEKTGEIASLITEFKLFVMDSIENGGYENWGGSDLGYLQNCMDNFVTYLAICKEDSCTPYHPRGWEGLPGVEKWAVVPKKEEEK